jgi:hypothetical protein
MPMSALTAAGASGLVHPWALSIFVERSGTSQTKMDKRNPVTDFEPGRTC